MAYSYYNPTMQLQVGVKAFLKNKDGQYLMLKRSAKKYPNIKGHWDNIGGRINPGITLLKNLAREIKEETNLDLIDTPRLIAAQDILRVPGKHVVRLTYIGVIEGNPKLDSEEIEEFRWMSFSEITQLDDLDYYMQELFLDADIVAMLKE